MKIQEYLNNREKYKVDPTYQRENNVWSSEDKQCLIDTILRGEPMPLFFLNQVGADRYIVDGQQRLNCIEQFHENKIKLSGKFSGKENAGKTFGGTNPISDSQKQNFLDYELKCHIVANYDDPRVRLIFSRLQRGKPLVLGERLNAMPGKIVECMRSLAKFPFMQQSIEVSKKRYGLFPDVIRFILYAKYGAKDSGSDVLYDFMEKESDFNPNSPEYKKIVWTLNYLEKCFPPVGDKGYRHLEKHAWVLAVFTMIYELRKTRSLLGVHDKIGTFIKEFHCRVYDKDFHMSNLVYRRFYDSVRGGWSERLITVRRQIIIDEFLKGHPLQELDDKRQISDEDKAAAFAKQPTCSHCGAMFKDYKSTEYHHDIPYANGGQTNIQNIIVLCKKCHDWYHK